MTRPRMNMDEHGSSRPCRTGERGIKWRRWSTLLARSARGPLANPLFVIALTASLSGAAEWRSLGVPHAVIELHSQAVVAGPGVRLGEIANVRVADQRLRQEFEAVDVAGHGGAAEGRRVGRRYIDLRLQLAGYDVADYSLVGPAEVVLTQLPPQRLSDTEIEQLAAVQLSARWSVPESELQVTLAAPVMAPVESLLEGAGQPRFEVLPQGPATIGRVSMSLRVFDGERLLAVRPVQFDIARRVAVLASPVALSSGTALGVDSVQVEERFLLTAPELSTVEQVTGRRLARPLAAGEPLTARHLAPATASTEPPVIQTRDVVRVTARKGGLTIVLSQAEALQAGRVGQFVRLRNPESNKVVVGKVVAAGEVEVAL